MTIKSRVAVLCLAFGFAAAAAAVEPVSRPLADPPGVAKAKIKDQPRMPAPTVHVLTASLDTHGRMEIRCSADENPAYRAWREAAARRGVQER